MQVIDARTGGPLDAPDGEFRRLPPGQIAQGRNVRLEEAGIEELADSLRRLGMLQPITVAPLEKGYECLFGHRRLAAARLARLALIPCLVRPPGSPERRVLTQVAENRDRRPMTVLEEALAYEELKRLGMTQAQIASAVGTTQPAVSQRLLLLGYPDAIRMAVHHREITIGDALGIPLEVIAGLDEDRLRGLCARGADAIREWVRQQASAKQREGVVVRKRAQFKQVAIKADLFDQIAAIAAEDAMTTAVWLEGLLLDIIEARD